jgi:uncharacterized protein
MVFLAAEGEDLFDLIEWIGKQSWSDGTVGLRGASYTGTNQWYAALLKPSNLKCITPSATLGRATELVPYRHGVFKLEWALSWIGKSLNTPNNKLNWTNNSPTDWLLQRPLNTLDYFVTGRNLSLYREFLQHSTNDAYWKRLDISEEMFSNINIPSMAFTGWFDGTMSGTLLRFEEARKFSLNKKDHFLFLGPYLHLNAPDGGYDYITGEPLKQIGAFEFPDNAFIPGQNMTREFFDWCLKNKTRRPTWSQSNVYLTGTNEWIRGSKFLPDEGLEEKIFYLSNPSSNLTNGKLTFNPPEQRHNNTLRYDPKQPVRSDANKMIQLPIDLCFYFKKGNDFLVYTSEPFSRPTTIIGNLYVDLSISSDAKDTDFIIFLMVVYEDGRSIRLGCQISNELRARYRNGFDKEELMEKGKIYNVTILINEIGHTFQKGHSLRIAIANSFFPWISANPNTGNPIANDTSEPVVSQQTIYYGKTAADNFHLSRVRFTTYYFKNSGNKIEIHFFLIIFAIIIFI